MDGILRDVFKKQISVPKFNSFTIIPNKIPSVVRMKRSLHPVFVSRTEYYDVHPLPAGTSACAVVIT